MDIKSLFHAINNRCAYYKKDKYSMAPICHIFFTDSALNGLDTISNQISTGQYNGIQSQLWNHKQYGHGGSVI